MNNAAPTRAYVLCAVPGYRLRAGVIVEATAEVIAALVADGSVDAAPGALDYATLISAEVCAPYTAPAEPEAASDGETKEGI